MSKISHCYFDILSPRGTVKEISFICNGALDHIYIYVYMNMCFDVYSLSSHCLQECEIIIAKTSYDTIQWRKSHMLKANVFMTKCRGFICSIAKNHVQRELWNAIFKPKVEIYIYIWRFIVIR